MCYELRSGQKSMYQRRLDHLYTVLGRKCSVVERDYNMNPSDLVKTEKGQ